MAPDDAVVTAFADLALIIRLLSSSLRPFFFVVASLHSQ
jgi:hypothetical protein